MGSVRTILASLFTALGGFFLLAMTAGIGFALYVTAAPDSVTSTAEAQTVPSTSLFKPQASIASNSKLIRLASASSTMPFEIATQGADRGGRVRQLQKALARAECYDGPINGVWNAASKEAMRNFVRTANAELPVDGPDEALVALVESNDAVICERGRTIETGSLGSSLQIAAEQAHVEFLASKSAPPSTADGANNSQAEDSALLHRAWAPAEMLTPSKDNASEAAPPPVPAIELPRPEHHEIMASNDVTADVDKSSTTASTLHFEGGAPLPAVQLVDPMPAPSIAADEAPKPTAKAKKVKTAKRRAAKDEDVTTTISRGFDTLQRSISSMF